MNFLKGFVVWFIGSWVCPECKTEIIGLSVAKIKSHVKAHGLGEMASLLLCDVVLNLGGAALYPESTRAELLKWVEKDCQGRKISRGEGLPTYRLF